MKIKEHFNKISINQHLVASILIRLVLIVYGQIHDQHSEVPYTDVDYKVVTDGARHVLNGESPFRRHTYRYSPLLAMIQIPAVLFHQSLGKYIFSLFDIFVAILIYKIVSNKLRLQYKKAVQSVLMQYGKNSQWKQLPDNHNRPVELAKYSVLMWLYNPLTMVISTRGNGDSFSSFFVILTIYFITKSEEKSNLNSFLAGLSHGIAIHLRLYPILFSLALYLCLNEKLIVNVVMFFKQILMPNMQQILLVIGTLVSLTALTGFFYHLYGWNYIYEAYLYHFVRKDARHNFSLYFLMQYLSGNEKASLIEKILIVLPQLLLMLYLTISFGQFRQTLPFCIFAQTFIAVTYNSVVTSQYFVWYLALLPICLNNLQTMPIRTATMYFVIWLLGQGLWLLPAYLLEFKTWNTFNWIGGQAVFFFLINIFLLTRLIKYYSFTSFKIKFKKIF
ncbi:GPI mannosyltransferase 1 [Episyrphus balteatus]|uniref:GPI mannosyltransferase 1 n=1 Tax=Episyrphus balteatus TaxID=286459 RepID=UPI0024861BBB|nr:GPI mannosyltransferase 1 [Episyrphus balteatus]